MTAEQFVDRAVQALKEDAGSSPVLAAVVQELEKKMWRVRYSLSEADAATIREAVVELEQAADSAKVAAEADMGAKEETRTAIIAAHDHICQMKRNM